MWHWISVMSSRRALGTYLANSLHTPADQSADTWLALAKIYRESGRRMEYEVLAGQMKERFDIQLPIWGALTQ